MDKFKQENHKIISHVVNTEAITTLQASLKIVATYFEQNRYQEAINDLEKLIKDYPNNKKLKVLYYVALCKNSKLKKDYKTYIDSIYKLYPHLHFSDLNIFYGFLCLYFCETKTRKTQRIVFEIHKRLKKSNLTENDFVWLAKKNYYLAKETCEKTFYEIAIMFLKKALKQSQKQESFINIAVKIVQLYLETDDIRKAQKYLQFTKKYQNKNCDLICIQTLLNKHKIFSEKYPEKTASYKILLNYILERYDRLNFKQYAWVADVILGFGTDIQDKDFYRISIFFNKKAIKKSKNYSKCLKEFQKIFLTYYALKQYYFAKGYVYLTNKYTKNKVQRIKNNQFIGELYFLLSEYKKSIAVFSELLKYTNIVEKAYIQFYLARNYIAIEDVENAKLTITQAHLQNTTNKELKEEIDKLYKDLTL